MEGELDLPNNPSDIKLRMCPHFRTGQKPKATVLGNCRILGELHFNHSDVLTRLSMIQSGFALDNHGNKSLFLKATKKKLRDL